jgi:hypothetical protein
MAHQVTVDGLNMAHQVTVNMAIQVTLKASSASLPGFCHDVAQR